MKRKANIKSVGMLILFLYVICIFAGQKVNIYRLKSDIKEKHSELSQLKEKNQRLQDEINMSKTDMYMEKLARERLGLIKEGETPVIHNADDNK